MNDIGVTLAGEAAARAAVDDRSDMAKALNRIADALFRQAKASERAVALQEEMVNNQRQLAQSSAALEQVLMQRTRQ